MSHICDDLRPDTDHATVWTKLVSPFDLETSIDFGEDEHDVEDELLEASLEEYQ